MNALRPLVFGEVLFDHFPDGRRVLGGAPFNVAWHLQAFGQAPLLVSRVGADSDGDAVRAAMEGWGMDAGALQTDPKLPTGRVTVALQRGEPAYEIVHPSAWDAINVPAGLEDHRILYHGTLALRESVSRRTLGNLRDRPEIAVFLDVNLRPPWWRPELVFDSLKRAQWAKLNTDELELLDGGDGSLRGRAEQFLDRHGLRGMVVTRGAAGAMVLTEAGGFHEAPAAPAESVRDTVGAGDAFASVTLLGLGLGWPLDTTLHRALRFAAHLCERRGATVPDRDFYRGLRREWGLPEPEPRPGDQ